MPYIIIIIFILALDIASKLYVNANIEPSSTIPVINNFFYLTNVQNNGAAWSMFRGGRVFFIIITVIVLSILIFFFFKSSNKFLKTSLSFIIGGAVGNLIDRIVKGSVVDFFGFNFGSYSFPIFNVADCFVVVGTILLSIYLLFIYKESPKEIK